MRLSVLRKGLTADHVVYDKDDDPETLHLGAFTDDRVLSGIATVMHDPAPGSDDPKQWRLRGMATPPEARGSGYGGALLLAAIGHVAVRGGTQLWCNARSPAMGFYRKYGFETIGEEFALPPYGPHYMMARRLVAQTDCALASPIIYFSAACG